jgi:2-amino-4-hydroxy-6-hydroxymethyldihydropteridine diphosphokinase
MNQEDHRVVILIGSNISPAENLKNAYYLLCRQTTIIDISQVWENAAVGSPGPNFLNTAVMVQTPLSAARLKDEILHSIENQLGRIRTQDKNSPRTIDLDIILFDQQVLDQNIWSRLHIALPVSELVPDIANPFDGKTLAEIAHTLQKTNWAEHHPEILRETETIKKKLCS